MLTGSAVADESIAGFIAGASATLVLHPMDLLKVRQQLSQSSLSNIINTLNRSGIKAFYRGVSPNLAGSTLSWGIYFGFYAKMKQLLGPEISSWKHLTASILSGSFTILLINPVWVIKTRMLNQNVNDLNAYKSLSDGLRKLWIAQGVKGYYKGIIPGLFGTLHGAVQFVIYEKLKSQRKSSVQSNYLNTSDVLITSSVSKVLATIITYPYQVVRSRLQIQTLNENNGIIKILRECIRKPSLFYRGLGINCLRVLPGTMITFGVYEGLMKVFKEIPQ